MNIIVLGGGLSSERDVSLSTSGEIAAALIRNGHRALVIDTVSRLETFESFDELYSALKKDSYVYKIPETEPDLERVRVESGIGNALLGDGVLEACRLADVVFIGLHGSIGENGQLQAIFDVYGVKYTGSGYVGSLLAMDKVLAKQMMVAHGVKTPKYEIISGNTRPSMAFPFVMKPQSGGSSVGVTLVKTEADLNTALVYAREYESTILIEEFIPGREFSAGVLGNEALPVIEIIPETEFFDYKAKYQGASQEVCPADIPPELEQKMRAAALKVHNALRLDCYSRTDFIVDAQGEMYCLESNSLPGMTPNSLIPQEARAAGIEYDALCERVVHLKQR